jgi:Flp pilus assembly pilin Flp
LKSFDPMLAARSLRCTRCRGQTLVEYALILAFISVVAISVLIHLGQQAESLYSTINTTLADPQAG